MPSRAEGTPAPLFLPDLNRPGEELSLDEPDAHYLTRVCRVGPGERIEAVDGKGTRARLEVISTRGGARVRVEHLVREPQPAARIVACGAPEKDRADWLVEKLAELGVTEFQPIECDRARWERWEGRRDRLERLALAALRQSRGSWRLRLLEPAPLGDWLAGLPGGEERRLADPAGSGWTGGPPDRPAVVAVGPSSGFSEPERQRLVAADFRPLRLAPGRLRTETAAIAWAALAAVREADR